MCKVYGRNSNFDRVSEQHIKAEVDEAFGEERLPSGVPDREALPFVRACYLEVSVSQMSHW